MHNPKRFQVEDPHEAFELMERNPFLPPPDIRQAQFLEERGARFLHAYQSQRGKCRSIRP